MGAMKTGIRHRLVRAAYRRYRAANVYFLSHPPGFFARAFYAMRERLQTVVSARRITPFERLQNSVWKSTYFQRFGTESLYQLVSNRPVAIDAADHKWPRGTLYDSSTNRNFNLKLYAFMQYRPDLREGSDVSKKLRSGEWDTCPLHLFTADITSPFQVKDQSGVPVQFHCVTAWEVLEHIPADRLPALADNIAAHLAPDGIFVASVDTLPDGNPITGAIYHVTLRPKSWWLEQFEQARLVEANDHPFTTQDYVRGHGIGLQDWDPTDGHGFHLVLRRNG
jgi:hypothetical protein